MPQDIAIYSCFFLPDVPTLKKGSVVSIKHTANTYLLGM